MYIHFVSSGLHNFYISRLKCEIPSEFKQVYLKEN